MRMLVIDTKRSIINQLSIEEFIMLYSSSMPFLVTTKYCGGSLLQSVQVKSKRPVRCSSVKSRIVSST